MSRYKENLIKIKYRGKQLCWYGYTQRMEVAGLPKKCYEWIPQRKKKGENQEHVGKLKNNKQWKEEGYKENGV